MQKISSEEIQNLLSIDTFNDASLFTVSIIDIDNQEVIYTNQAMKNIMSDLTAKKCWESVNAQEERCEWCKVPYLLNKMNIPLNPTEPLTDSAYSVYEHFNEVANKWYQVQEKIVILKDLRRMLISFSLDISLQKEAQSKLIDTHVKLTRQTEALKKAQEKLKNQANRDPLTDMYNRRYFAEISSNIIEIAKRKKENLSLFMIDIDKFKNINDTYGHNIGDEIILLLVDTLNNKLRKSDIAARFGGEEFAIILPNTEKKYIFAIAENIRKEVEKLVYKSDVGDVKFTISLGIGNFEYASDKSIEEALKRADKALYYAKEHGRNQVCSFEALEK